MILSCSKSQSFFSVANKETNAQNILKYFGEQDFNKAVRSLYTETQVNGKQTRLSIDFNKKDSHSHSSIEKANRILENLDALEESTYNTLLTDFENSGTTLTFLELYSETLTKEDFKFLGVDHLLTKDAKLIALLNTLHLRNIGVYPDSPKGTLVFDYTLSKDGLAVIDYMLVFKYNEHEELLNITIES